MKITILEVWGRLLAMPLIFFCDYEVCGVEKKAILVLLKSTLILIFIYIFFYSVMASNSRQVNVNVKCKSVAQRFRRAKAD